MIGAVRIELLRRSQVSDGQGGWIEGFAVIATEGGRVRPASGRERELASRLQQDVSHVAYLRAAVGAKAGDRLRVRGVDLDVLAVRQPGLANRHIELDCREVGA